MNLPARRDPMLAAALLRALEADLVWVPVAQAELRVYFGNLHAHSQLSDGNEETTPDEAYQLAKTRGQLDFLCLSEHNHMLTQTEMEELREAAAAATEPGFVALFGQEFSTIKKGFNHTNIHNYPLAIPESYNGHYRDVFEGLLRDFATQHPDSVLVAGFNHPNTIDTDYGLKSDYDGNWATFVTAMDPIVKLIAIGNGPADANSKSFTPAPGDDFLHRDVSTSTWFAYLAKGMHLAPEIDHDTHSPTYGFRVDGRTAVWIDGALTRGNLLEALSKRHCYATEDRNLSIVPTLESGFLPGDIVPVEVDGNLALDLSIADPDEAAATYRVEVWSATGSGKVPQRDDAQTVEHSGNGIVSIALSAAAPSVHVVHVLQQSPGGPCGKADDAWLAPIWIAEVAGDDLLVDSYAFVGSKNSDVYHVANCKDVGRIKSENLRYYDSAPEDKRLHSGCPRL